MKSKDLYKKTDGVLFNYNSILTEIKNTQIEIEEIENEYRGCGAIGYEERTGETFKINKPVEEEVIKKVKLIQRMEREKESKERLIKKIDNAMATLEELERKIIELRCMQGKQWKEIGDILDVDYDYAGKIKRIAVNKISELIWIKEKFQ